MSRIARYKVTVWIDVDMEDGEDPAEYTTRRYQRELERDVIRTLERAKTIGVKIDAECTDVDVVTS